MIADRCVFNAFLNRFKSSEVEASPETAALIVGLGNPGSEYSDNRHNVGFMAADRWARAHALLFSKIQQRAIVAIGRSGERRVIIAKPQTYMNDSGRAVGALLRFYKIPVERLLVIFDDLDLPFGVIRLRADGGAGGHNGMRSIIQHLGGNQFARLRIGIGRPLGRMDPAALCCGLQPRRNGNSTPCLAATMPFSRPVSRSL
jgi:PTH1 family peptidyl-tRNA hydrolase